MWRMVERGEHLGFTAEPRAAFGIVGEGRRQDLQRDVATELRILPLVDFGHAASPKLRLDLVGAKTGTTGEYHGR
jgi:hypothetical protein